MMSGESTERFSNSTYLMYTRSVTYMYLFDHYYYSTITIHYPSIIMKISECIVLLDEPENVLNLQMQSAYAELQRESAKQQSILEARAKRIKELESLLKKTKEAADREYLKLQMEKEQIKSSLMARLREKERE